MNDIEQNLFYALERISHLNDQIRSLQTEVDELRGYKDKVKHFDIMLDGIKSSVPAHELWQQMLLVLKLNQDSQTTLAPTKT